MGIQFIYNYQFIRCIALRRDHDPLLNGRTSTKITDCSTKHRAGEKRICHGRIQCNNFCSVFYELGADGLRVLK